jgi:hypothetical protein
MKNKKLAVNVNTYSIEVGNLSISFERTLRIPDDDQVYPLPPSLGSFPICKVEDYLDKVPEAWREKGGVFIPMYQREALWLSLSGSTHAVIIDAGNINAISGKEKADKLQSDEQNYIVSPDQPWLDGFNVGEGFIRQFTAMPLGSGYSVEEQLSTNEATGGMRFIAYKPKPGLIPESLIVRNVYCDSMVVTECDMSMGLSAGGKMEQDIYPDEYGIDVWDPKTKTELYVHIANSELYKEITGHEPPSSPISAETYTQYGYPWFKLYNEGKGDIPNSKQLSTIKSVKYVDQEKGLSHQYPSFTVPNGQIVSLEMKK